jgi:hypothetical protein
MDTEGAPKQSTSTAAADVAMLRDEQLSDETLKSCFALASQAKGSFFLRDGISLSA